MNIITKKEKLSVGTIIKNADMKKFTTYKAGGHALCIVSPYNETNLIKLMRFINENSIKYKVIGNCSNLIFSDELYDGILIKLDEFDTLYIKNNIVTVGAGYSLMKLALKVSHMGLSGLEFAAGIPGTIGGSVFMNAGAYNSDMGYIVKKVKVLTPELKIITLYNHDLDFHYRTSFLQKNPAYICLEATLELIPGDEKEIMEIIKDRRERRIKSQPLEYPSAGSVFRNPKDNYAGKLIEEIGYKGKRIGDAAVSEKHANFVINLGNAKGNDIKKLILDIKKKVKEEKGIELKIEQEFVE